MKRRTLKQARKSKKWTQQVLAAKSGIDQRAISKIERGGTTDVMNSTAEALEEALGVKRGSLVYGRQQAVA